ncbi:D-alanine--D-alanine ligase [soil metagenome]
MKQNIAFVTGGYSGEAEISYKSALTIEKNLDKERWQVYKIDITTDGWFYETPKGDKINIDKNNFTLSINDEKIFFDAVLIGIHGTPGEDGKLQGYFDMLRIPYTSCDTTTTALTFNKRYTVATAAFSGIAVAKSVILFSNYSEAVAEINNNLKFPVFVKPNNGGSSIGMSRVKDSNDLKEALAKAFKEDDQVLVEEFIEGRELTIGVFKSKGEIIALPITEIISKKEFFDFEAKYHGASDEVTPAQISKEIEDAVKETAIRVYKLFNCNGIVRIDFIYNDKENKPYMLEINTVPGQSEASIVPQQVKAFGWTLEEFYSALLEECLHS